MYPEGIGTAGRKYSKNRPTVRFSHLRVDRGEYWIGRHTKGNKPNPMDRRGEGLEGAGQKETQGTNNNDPLNFFLPRAGNTQPKKGHR
jgi:hypothetical protein